MGRDKPSPYGFGELGVDVFVLKGVGGRFGLELDGEGGFEIAVQDLGDPVEDVAHAPLVGEVEDVIPMHAVAIFSQEEDEVDVAVEAGIENAVVEEVEAEVQEGDFGGEAEELQAGAVGVGLGGAPNFIQVDGEGGLPPGKGEKVGVEVDVDAGGVAVGDFEGDVDGRRSCICRGGFRTRPYGNPDGVAEGCHVGGDGVVILGVDEDVHVAEGAEGWIGVEVGDEGPAFEDEEL